MLQDAIRLREFRLPRAAAILVMAATVAAAGCTHTPHTKEETAAGAAGGVVGAVGGGIGGAAYGGAAGFIGGLACGPGAALCAPALAIVGVAVGGAVGAIAGAVKGGSEGIRRVREDAAASVPAYSGAGLDAVREDSRSGHSGPFRFQYIGDLAESEFSPPGLLTIDWAQTRPLGGASVDGALLIDATLLVNFVDLHESTNSLEADIVVNCMNGETTTRWRRTYEEVNAGGDVVSSEPSTIAIPAGPQLDAVVEAICKQYPPHGEIQPIRVTAKPPSPAQ
jgi:hypothetical protein